MKNSILVLLCCCGITTLWSQTIKTSDLNFGLYDGIYLSRSSFLENRPDFGLTKLRYKSGKIAQDIDLNDSDYFIRTGDSLVPFIADSIFGYATNGVFYFKFTYEENTYFGRSLNPGELWHFVGTVITYSTSISYDPFYPGSTTRTPVKELVQFIYDVPNDKILQANTKSLLPILMEDDEVAALIKEQPKRKRKDLLFYFLRKYNKKYPVTFTK